MKLNLILLLLLAITSVHSQIARADQPFTAVADGIDIYSSMPSRDGENHYIHIERNPNDGSRYIFQYCRNGLPLDLAKRGLFPESRDCYLTIGSSEGYTGDEIQAEIDLMEKQAKAQNRSQMLSTFGSGVVSGVVVLVALNVVEAIATGGIANVPTDAAALGGGALGGLGRYLGGIALKKLALDGSKLVISTVVGTFIGQIFTSTVGQAAVEKTNDNAFSSPSQEKAAAEEVDKLFASGSVVVIPDNIQSFESELSGILAKII